MSRIKMFYSRVMKLSLVVLALLLMVGCAVTLVSNYDEQTDKSVTELQKKLDSFLVKLEGSPVVATCTYKANEGFYESVNADVSSILFRAKTIPKNEITVEEVELLSKSINAIRKDHELAGNRCMSKDQIEHSRETVNGIFRSILTLEIAKKRGAK